MYILSSRHVQRGERTTTDPIHVLEARDGIRISLCYLWAKRFG
jgi:hypothetical protein